MNAEASHQVTATIFQLKNADPEEWRDKQALEHSGPDGGAIKSDGSLTIQFLPVPNIEQK